ncbi:MAG: GDSL-type esterase/lipase family protein [archaeon]
MTHLLVFGDSIAQGFWDTEGGWVQRLKKFVDNQTLKNPEFFLIDYISIYNQSVDGNSSLDLLERFEFESKQRIDEGIETIVVFAIGANDAGFVQSKNDNYVNFEEFKENLAKLIAKARKFSSKIIFVGLTPVDESKTNPLPWNKDFFSKNEFIKKYDVAIKKVCVKEGVLFCELFEKFSALDYKKLLADGEHPNNEGHQKIFEIVKEFLIKEKLI